MLLSRVAPVGLSLMLFACGGRAVGSTSSTNGSNTDPGTELQVDTPTEEAQPPGPVPPTPVGGNCTYRRVPGTATVTALTPSVDDVTIGVCHRATTKVTFTFAAADGSPLQQKGQGDVLTIDSDLVFPTSCVAPAALEIGATFEVTRDEEVTGTCSPVVYRVAAKSPVHACECVVCDETGTGGCF
jgi:hypothetical protein